MAEHETQAATDEWYTPAWVFEQLGVRFDLDPCDGPECKDGLTKEWHGTVWLNPPFGKRNGIRPWLDKFIEHGNGIAIVPNRTATDWFQVWAQECDVLLFVRGKIRFIRPDGSEGKSPGYGNVLGAVGPEMARALNDSKVVGLRTVLGG